MLNAQSCRKFSIVSVEALAQLMSTKDGPGDAEVLSRLSQVATTKTHATSTSSFVGNTTTKVSSNSNNHNDNIGNGIVRKSQLASTLSQIPLAITDRRCIINNWCSCRNDWLPLLCPCHLSRPNLHFRLSMCWETIAAIEISRTPSPHTETLPSQPIDLKNEIPELLDENFHKLVTYHTHSFS